MINFQYWRKRLAKNNNDAGSEMAGRYNNRARAFSTPLNAAASQTHLQLALTSTSNHSSSDLDSKKALNPHE